jgi:hypothetical protein
MSDQVANKPVSNLPSAAATFVGRADSLEQIRTGLAAHGRVLVHGPAGSGRTSLALEHARRHAADYDVIWLVPAAREPLVDGHLAGAAFAAGLVAPDVTTPAALAAVHAAMAAGRWLLIFDDAAPEVRLPTGGHLIVTSRRPETGGVEVGSFRRDESAGLLRHRLDALTAEEAGALAAAQADHPHRVAQAAALIRLDPDRCPVDPVAAAIDRLADTDPAAVQLLCLCAVLGPEPIPHRVLSRSLPRLPAPLGRLRPGDLGALVDALVAHGLADQELRTHPLVRAAVLDQLGDEAAGVCRSYAGALVTAALPDHGTALAPHLLALDPARSTDPAVRAAAGRLVHRLLLQAEPRAALSVAADLESAWRRLLGPDHPHTLAAATWRSRALLTLGAFREAAPVIADTVDRCRAALGEDHPHTLHAEAEQALARTMLGDYAGSRALHESVHARRLASAGPDHPDTLRAAAGLSRSLNLLGRPAEALRAGQDAHQRCRRLLGPDHPDTLRAALEPAVSLAALGRDLEAARQAVDTLARCRRVFGADHPQTLAAAHCVAAVRHGSGDRPEGRRLHQDVLSRRTAVLGPDHPDTLRSAFAVAVALLAGGAVLPARALLDETLGRLVLVLGPDHPLTRNVRERRRQARQLMGGAPGTRKKPGARKRKRS